jgi:Putative restriction endonuclease
MNIAFTRAADGLPRRAFTVDDISDMIEAGIVREDERFELIEGDIVMMSPKPIAHDRVKNVLTMALVRAAPTDVFVAIEATLQLARNIWSRPTSPSWRARSIAPTRRLLRSPGRKTYCC